MEFAGDIRMTAAAKCFSCIWHDERCSLPTKEEICIQHAAAPAVENGNQQECVFVPCVPSLKAPAVCLFCFAKLKEEWECQHGPALESEPSRSALLRLRTDYSGSARRLVQVHAEVHADAHARHMSYCTRRPSKTKSGIRARSPSTNQGSRSMALRTWGSHCRGWKRQHRQTFRETAARTSSPRASVSKAPGYNHWPFARSAPTNGRTWTCLPSVGTSHSLHCSQCFAKRSQI